MVITGEPESSGSIGLPSNSNRMRMALGGSTADLSGRLRILMSESTLTPAPGELPVLRIFISHKAKDKEAAQKLKDILGQRCTKVELFLSSDAKSLQGGKPWWDEIHNALDAAHWLIMIYTNPSENWDWCVYEAGYFAGRQGVDRAKSLVVLHPLGVVPPAPLAHWQSVPADFAALCAFFGNVFRIGDPTCHFVGIEADLLDVARKITDAIGRLRSQSFLPNKSLTVVVKHTACGTTPLPLPGDPVPADLPTDTVVELQEPTAELFGLAAVPQIAWPLFRGLVRAFGFDAETLVEAVHMARTHRAIPSAMAMFRAPGNGRAYRPLIYSVTCKDDGEVRVQVVLAPVPQTMDPESSNALEYVHRLFCLCKQFRTGVVERHGHRLSKLTAKTSSAERRQFLAGVLRDVDDLRAEAANQGFRGPSDQLHQWFDAAHHAQLAELSEKWANAYDALRRAADGAVQANPADIINPMRLINLAFFRLASTRLQQLVEGFVPPRVGRINPVYRELIPSRDMPSGPAGAVAETSPRKAGGRLAEAARGNARPALRVAARPGGRVEVAEQGVDND
jgi:hypothetical protein